MKKILSSVLVLMLFAGAAGAQSTEKVSKHEGRHGAMKELNLTEDQKAKFKALHAQEKSEMEALKKSGVENEQLKEKRMELHKKYRDQFQSILTPAQKEQMEKQHSQKEGKFGNRGHHGLGKKDGQAFGKRGEAAGALNLSQEQKDRLKEMRTASKGKFDAIRNDKSLSDAQKKEKLGALRSEEQAQMKSILTQEQLEKMKSFRKSREEKSTK